MLLVIGKGYSQDRNQLRKIDMHLHALPPAEYNAYWVPRNLPFPTTKADLIRETVRSLEQFNIVKAVTSGRYELVKEWKAAAPDRIIPALHFWQPDYPDPNDLSFLRQEYTSGRLQVFGEVVAQLQGLSPSDSTFEPYLALCEELDVPVAIHTGFPPPGAAYVGLPKLRAALGNPLLLEDALVRHPRLRIYIMHAGYPFIEETIALLHAHPQVYVDLAGIDWVIPRKEFQEHLRRLVQAGFGQRLMFGSDQMGWPAAIGLAIEAIESAPFLTPDDKRNIFYNNAARFLKLDGSEGPTSTPGPRRDGLAKKKTANQPGTIQ
jgi:predicted TIM-barrel fold metal-dependent hydrolase